MSALLVRNFLINRLAGSANNVVIGSGDGEVTFPVIKPGVDGSNQFPRIELSIPVADQETITLKGDGVVETGVIFAIPIEKSKHDSLDRLMEAAEVISARAGRRRYALNSSGQLYTAPGVPVNPPISIQIRDVPNIRSMYREGTAQGIPVVIRYRASWKP